jgi:hypothetical protein
MCHERWMRRRTEADESRELWREFDRTQPVTEPEPRVVEDEDEEVRERPIVRAES